MSYAGYCERGHLVGIAHSPRTAGQLRAYAEREANGGTSFRAFCTECGSPTVSRCPHCTTRIAPDARYCGDCGKPFPWTEHALATAREYTDELDLSQEEKAELKGTFDDLTVETARTPLALSRYRKYIRKLSPTVGGVLQKILETVVAEAVKKGMTGL
jgi:hypothetical protein